LFNSFGSIGLAIGHMTFNFY